MTERDNIVIGPDAGDGNDGAPDDSPIEALRAMPVGTNDPNIVGDVGPVDVPPGTDPRGEGELRLGTSEPARPTDG
jgi:hypothetical protein